MSFHFDANVNSHVSYLLALLFHSYLWNFTEHVPGAHSITYIIPMTLCLLACPGCSLWGKICLKDLLSKIEFWFACNPCWDLSALDYGALCGVEIEILCVLRMGECSTMFVLYLHNNVFWNFALIKLSFHFFFWSFCFLWIFSCKESSITYI
jgi:hypothetical protein